MDAFYYLCMDPCIDVYHMSYAYLFMLNRANMAIDQDDQETLDQKLAKAFAWRYIQVSLTALSLLLFSANIGELFLLDF